MLYLNSIFSFGKRFLEQLKEGQEFYEVIPDIPRWEEFLRIIGAERFVITD